MEKIKYYKVGILGMNSGENYELEVPDVIENKYIIKTEDGKTLVKTKYIGTPLYAKMIDGCLYDVITGDLIRIDSLNKKTICDKPELVASCIEEVSANKVMGGLNQLTKEDRFRYEDQLERIKNTCFKAYRRGSREIKEYTEIQEIGYYMFNDIIEEYGKEFKEEKKKRRI